ncbi:MAG: tRNA preQ1(34) S-adenosylmethionine ribosyltransferase-isomerase QueA [Chloroflexi bacterium]|nr:tRNA preQ1(34) S-adenosylmethionine ribosyltransferase-isomerase QueA [Chloroflexota bacterium]
MKTSDYDYDLPEECIAQTPVEPRHNARLLVMNRRTGELQHSYFFRLGEHLRPGDLLVLNETRVIPARLFARKVPGGGRVEVLLLRRVEAAVWEALVGGKGLRPGKVIEVEEGPEAEIAAELGGARRLVRFAQPIEAYFSRAGHTPLPPYIHTALADPERYQTVFACQPGSAAAPTAGLHFTDELMQGLAAQGVAFVKVVLHVGLDTFAPVTDDDPQEHKIHSEWREVTEQAAEAVHAAQQRGGRVIAVGTTSVRTLESAAQGGAVRAAAGPTSLYILPGYEFRAVDGLITNFHLPRSTLLMLVSAFAGRERILEAYRNAVANGYRFYSFGDAMFIV